MLVMSGVIPRNIIEEIDRRLNPLEIIGEYVPLRRNGSRYVGLCPFHDEKTPSMSVNPDSGLWHCFGCGASGNLCQFVQRMEGLNYVETMRLLAGKAGVNFETSESALNDNSERLRALNLLDRAADFYRDMLLNSQAGQIGRDYLRERNISRDTAVKFRLGYAPDSSGLMQALRKAGFAADEAVKCGLLSANGYYGPSDVMRGRLIFPICDYQGRVLAFAGRSLGDFKPKYLNTSETPWYSKRHNLYGLHLAKNDIRKQHICVLVEGYFDVISLHQAGVTTAVASCGTALTPEQAQLLKRYSVSDEYSSDVFSVLLMYDSDAAGQKATLKGNEILEEAGLRSQAVFLPAGDDPDSLAQRGLEAVREALDGAEGIVSYMMRKLLTELDITTDEGKEDFVKQTLPLLRKVKDPVRQDVYLRKLAYYSGVNEARIYGLLRFRGRVEGREEKKLRRLTVEEELFRLCVSQPKWISVVREIITPDMLQDKTLQPYFRMLFALKDAEVRQEALTLSELQLDGSDEETKRLAELLTRDTLETEEEDVRKLASAVCDRVRRERLEELRREIVPALDAGAISMEDPRYQEYCQLKRYFHS